MDIVCPRDAELEVSSCMMSSTCSTRHKRSKSASDKNLDFTRHGTSYCVGKDYCKLQNYKNLNISHGPEDDDQGSSNIDHVVSADHRASLENDIKQLQMHLRQEKSIRLMLEKTIGRASSTLSPGHRHFNAQTRELIAEIELLEEEISNREQHVLFLYRSIFDQCISAPSSRQSSGMTSPAHTKNIGRKHPSIISSAFCSSKKFSLQPFQVLASIKETGKRSVLPKGKVRHEMQLSRNISTPDVYNASDHMKAAYNIAGHIVTANSIEHSILQFRTPRVGRWFEAIISTAMKKKSAEEKQLISSNFNLVTSQPLVLFALCTGASSDPMLRVYTAKSVADELQKAKRDFLLANVLVKKSRKVFLPKLLDRYAKEASLSCDELLAWVSSNMDGKLHDAIHKCVNARNKKATQVIDWLPYNTKFRYVFGKDFTQKPWWM